MAVVETRFRVMASGVQVLLNNPAADAQQVAEARLRQLEQLWSRFLPVSDISALASAQGRTVEVHPDTVVLLETMQRAHRQTFGAFDPTMLREIVAMGYDASVEVAGHRSITIDMPYPTGTVDDIIIDQCSVRLPEGMALDPGGIGKGLAADLVATELVRGGTSGALVSVGGDLSAVGEAPSGGWRISVEDPFRPGSSFLTVAIDAGGVATSSTLSRTWKQGHRDRHHVLNPKTGVPSKTDLAAMTVFAPSAWQAEVHATAALLEGSSGATTYLASQGLSGVAVCHTGTVLCTPDLAHCIDQAQPVGAGQ